ncbi:MAG: hypothetical protein AMJ61_16280 [Desulfobacterales bacterium SG8_35_2]|nr:MAG: hypothetical protein AMJ61_16280 [Desulfobacterales bacterium SG8_35_2]
MKKSNSIDLQKICKFVNIYFFAIRNHHSFALFFHGHSEKLVKKFLFPLTAFFFIIRSLVGPILGKASDPGPETMELKSITAKKPARSSHKKTPEILNCEECHQTKSGNGNKSH